MSHTVFNKCHCEFKNELQNYMYIGFHLSAILYWLTVVERQEIIHSLLNLLTGTVFSKSIKTNKVLVHEWQHTILILLETDNESEAQWLSGRVLDSRPKGHRLEPHRRHCVVSLSKTHQS